MRNKAFTFSRQPFWLGEKKSRWQGWLSPATNTFRMRLEPQLRSKRHPQIVEGSVAEIDLVADFGAKPKRSPESFEADARVHGEVRAGSADA